MVLDFAYYVEDYFYFRPKIQILGFVGIMIVAFASFVFAVDSFRRLNKCLENHDRLGITKKQIILNTGVFFLAFLNIFALMGSVM